MWIFDKERYKLAMEKAGSRAYDWADEIDGKRVYFDNDDDYIGECEFYLIARDWCRKVK